MQGLRVIRIRGSHHFVRHPDGRATVVAVHSGEHIGPGLLSKILVDCEMTREEFGKLLYGALPGSDFKIELW